MENTMKNIIITVIITAAGFAFMTSAYASTDNVNRINIRSPEKITKSFFREYSEIGDIGARLSRPDTSTGAMNLRQSRNDEQIHGMASLYQ